MQRYFLKILGPGFLLPLLWTINSIAQELPYKKNLSWEHERHSWMASWISPPEESLSDYGVFLFRNTFKIESVPDSFNIYVSADNRYRLYINGKYVNAGPARGSYMYWRYETLDIASYLNEGENILAAEVINFGEHRPVAQFSRQTAFILQSERLGKIINTGMGNWMVKKDNSFNVRPVTKQMTLDKYYVAGPCDSINIALHPWNWKESKFNTDDWGNPVIVQKGVGRGYMHGTPWMLVPREIPLLEEKIERIPRMVRATGISMDQDFIFGQEPLLIPGESKVTILFDQTYLTVGYPVFNISRGKEGKIKVIYSEALYDKDGNKGNRNEIEGKEIVGYSDIIVPDGGNNREIKTTWIRTYRYIQMEIETSEEPLYINDFYGLYTTYPFEQKAKFETSDPTLSHIWNVAWRTARLCAGETYMDCPYWEQLQYLGDTRIQSLISLYVAEDDLLMRNAIKLADHSRLPEGLTLSRGPSYIPQIIPAFSLYWIAMVHDYYMYREDDEFIKSCLPGIQAVLGWFERRIDKNNMIGILDWFNFADWTDGFAVGAPGGVDDGNSALVSLNLVYALDRASELFGHLEHEYEAKKYKELADRIRSSVYENCWSDSMKLMADTPDKQVYSQHTNIFSILTDCVPEENQEKLMDQILDNKKLIQTTIYYKFYLFEALQKTGMADKYLSLLHTWKNMLNEGLTTFAEGDYKDRSDCHAWSASPLYHFLSSVGGIRPGSPGFKSVIVAPKFGDLNEIQVTMPHPQGKIKLDLKRQGQSLEGNIVLPEGIPGELIWREKKIILNGGHQEFNL